MPQPSRRHHGSEPSPAIAGATLDALYDFALTVTWDPDTAERAVTRGVARAGRRASVGRLFATVRDFAVSLAPDPATVVLDLHGAVPPTPAGVGPTEVLALGAADSIDPADRAVVDLALRSGLEGDDLAAALRVPPDEVPALVDAARTRADSGLRDYVLARVGGENCPRLADALRDVPPHLPQVSEQVDAHCDDCSICSDHRVMLGQPTALFETMPRRAAPEDLHERLAPPPAEAPGEGGRRGRRWRRRLAATTAIAAVLAAGLLVAASLFEDDGGEAADDPEPPAPAEVVSTEPRRVEFGDEGTEAAVTLRNSGEEALRFRTETDVEWLSVDPADGTVGPGSSAELTLVLDRAAAPEGQITTTARVVTEARTVEIDVTGDVSHPPVITELEVSSTEISMAPCEGGTTTSRIRVTLDESSELAGLAVHWSGLPGPDGSTEGAVGMATEDGRYTTALGPFTAEGTVIWFVEVADTAGDVGRSGEQALTVVAACDAPPPDETAGT